MNLERLRQERKNKGFTQQYMSEQLGFKDRSSYCLIEKGKIKVSVELANRIAAILQLSPDVTYIIFFAEKVEVS